MCLKALQAIAGPFFISGQSTNNVFPQPSPFVEAEIAAHRRGAAGRVPVEMMIRTFIFLSLLFFPGAFSFAGDDRATSVSGETSFVERTFGSQSILSTLWTPEELSGKSEDNKKVPYQNSHASQPDIPANILDPLVAEFQNSIRSVIPGTCRKVIALTFDLCESANRKSGYDADIINYLREHQVKATFFAGGLWMASHPEKIQQLMADPLFEIGNHSWSHANFRKIDADRMRNEVLHPQILYETYWETLRQRSLAAGIDPLEMNKIPAGLRLFRFPYGTCTPQALDMLKQYGLPAIQWDVVSGDPSPDCSPRSIAEMILQKSRTGSIVICHANGRGHGTARSLPLFVPKLRENGFDFVTVSQLLTLGKVISVQECYERVPGDNQRYDKTGTEKRNDN
jgi:peptidoglycan/xylan/chitin deacetylase (PgdA/CDA1 family)